MYGKPTSPIGIIAILITGCIVAFLILQLYSPKQNNDNYDWNPQTVVEYSIYDNHPDLIPIVNNNHFVYRMNEANLNLNLTIQIKVTGGVRNLIHEYEIYDVGAYYIYPSTRCYDMIETNETGKYCANFTNPSGDIHNMDGYYYSNNTGTYNITLKIQLSNETFNVMGNYESTLIIFSIESHWAGTRSEEAYEPVYNGEMQFILDCEKYLQPTTSYISGTPMFMYYPETEIYGASYQNETIYFKDNIDYLTEHEFNSSCTLKLYDYGDKNPYDNSTLYYLGKYMKCVILRR